MECPVCFGEASLTLGCNHNICNECVSRLTSCACPMCRSSITLQDVGEDVIKSIIVNGIQAKKSQEDEDLRDLIETIRDENVTDRYTREDAQNRLECDFAFRYLREMGVPERYIPVDIIVKRPNTSPSPKDGSLFLLVVGTVMNELLNDLGDESSDVSEEVGSNDE